MNGRFAREALLILWFLLVAAVFFAPGIGFSLPDSTAVYGVFLLIFVGAFVLRFVRKTPGDSPAPVPLKEAVVPSTRERKRRRG